MSDPTANGGVAVDTYPVEEAVRTDGVYLQENGKVLFVIEDAPYTLRGPKIGEFRRLHTEWVAAVGLPADQQLDHQIAWVKLLFNGDPEADPPFRGLSDHPLPDDSNDWPTWVGVATFQSKIMIHFRDVPLARGGPVGN